MTKLYFVRHAEPNYNNHNDLLRELTPKGMEDRKSVTEFLSEKKIDVVISSPYKRAVDTVSDFAENYGFAIEIIDDFRERKVDSGWIEDFTEFTKRQWNVTAFFSTKVPEVLDFSRCEQIRTDSVRIRNRPKRQFGAQRS